MRTTQMRAIAMFAKIFADSRARKLFSEIFSPSLNSDRIVANAIARLNPLTNVTANTRFASTSEAQGEVA